MSKNSRMFQSEEAQAVSRASQELNAFTDALKSLRGEIGADNAKIAQENNKSFANSVSKFGQGVNILVDAATKLASIEYDKEFETIAARTDLLMADIDALSQKSIMAADLSSRAYLDAINSSLSSITDGINEGAYAAANNLIDLGAQSKIFGLEKERIELENKNTKNLRKAQRDATYSNLYAQQTQAEVTAGAELTRMGTHALDDVGAFGFSSGKALGTAGDILAGIAQGTAAATSTMIQLENRQIVQSYENEKKVTEAVLKSNQEVAKKLIEYGANVEKAWLQFAQKLENKLVQADFAANDMGISMGLNGKALAKFRSNMMAEQVKVASRWGKTLTDMQQAQTSYQEDIGRNVQMSSRDFDTTFALDKLAGTDGLSTQLASAMVPFNKSISSSNDMVFEMFQNVSKMGLSGRKYMKDLLKNLKLAEKHQFKGGVKGLMQMAAWASKTKFNMDSLDSMLDKVSEGGLEGVITQAAQLQVLGGAAAMGADPLAMMFERYNDPAAYAKRMNSMTRGMGTFDEKTGETWFNQGDQMRIEAMAKAQGRSKEDLFTEVRERNKRANIEKKIQPGKFNDDQLTTISSRAQWNQDKGQWEVTMNNGKPKAVSDLSADDIKNIMPTETNERIEMYVHDIRDMMTRLAAATGGMQAQLQSKGYSQWISEENKRIAQVTSEFRANYSTYLSEFKRNMGIATEAQKTLLAIMNQGNSNIDSASSEILNEGRHIASTLAQVNRLLQDSLNEINNRKDEYKPKPGEIAHDHPTPTTRLTPYDPRCNLTWKNPLDENKVPVTKPKVRQAQEAAKRGDFTTAVQNAHIGRGSIMDGVLKAEGQSMVVAASKVTPINDGEIATTDPQDHAIFAKTGGPFDTLFNGIFSKINEISKVLPQSVPYTFPEQPVKELYKPLYSQQGQAGDVSKSPIKIEPITLNINLNGALGKSKNFLEEITNNPMLVRSLSQLISESISKNVNGGKSIYTGDLSTPRFQK